MKINQPGAHLDHMLRQTRQHHVQLSAMADLKANMLLTVSAVMLSLTMPHVNEPHFRWAALVLMVFCLMTILLAAYAVMPKTPLGLRKGPPPNINSPGFNLLFFGDFSRLGYEEFDHAMEELLNDPSRAYTAQVKEVYMLGCFLAAKKYRYLRLAYLAFLTGLTASGIVLLGSGTLFERLRQPDIRDHGEPFSDQGGMAWRRREARAGRLEARTTIFSPRGSVCALLASQREVFRRRACRRNRNGFYRTRMRSTQLWLLGLALCGCLSAAHAEFDDGDDFNDNSVNTSKWEQPDTAFDGSLSETSGRLRYSTTAVFPFQAQSTRFWKLNLGTFTNDWFVQADVNNPFTSTDAQHQVDARLRVFNAADTAGDFAQVGLRFSGPGGPTNRFFFADAKDDNSTLVSNAVTTATAAAVRLRWTASNAVIHAEFDGDGAAGGYQWTNLASFKVNQNPVNWSLVSTSRFECALAGFSEFADVPGGSDVFLDNFRAVSAPLIATNPANQGIVQGSNATFTVGATGSALLAYQWQFNSNNLAGETNALLTLAGVVPSQAGVYRCVVTNEAGARASSNATLTVTALPSLTYTQSGPNFILSWPTNATGFTLQASASLTMTNWTNVMPAPATIGTNKVVTNSLIGAERYYRLFKP